MRKIVVLLVGTVAFAVPAAAAGPTHDWVGVTSKGVSFTFSSDGRRVTNLRATLPWTCNDPGSSHSGGQAKVRFRAFRLGRGAKVSMKQSFSTGEVTGTFSMTGALQNPRYKGYGKGRLIYTVTVSSGPDAGCTISRPSIAWAAKDKTLLGKK